MEPDLNGRFAMGQHSRPFYLFDDQRKLCVALDAERYAAIRNRAMNFERQWSLGKEERCLGRTT
jgi:hypothetical protein